MRIQKRILPAIEFDSRNFVCALGCTYGTLSSRMAMNTHIFECHSVEELEPWGINKDVLTGNSETKMAIKKPGAPSSAFHKNKSEVVSKVNLESLIKPYIIKNEKIDSTVDSTGGQNPSATDRELISFVKKAQLMEGGNDSVDDQLYSDYDRYDYI